MREIRVNQQEEYSTWSNSIMAKEHVWTLICHLQWVYYINLNYIEGVWHGWQLSFVVIYLVHVTKPQMFVDGLYGHMWGKPFTPFNTYKIMLMRFYAMLLLEVTKNFYLGKYLHDISTKRTYIYTNSTTTLNIPNALGNNIFLKHMVILIMKTYGPC